MNYRYQYFCNNQCEYYPCHEIAEGDSFNCLFCFCPLYNLDNQCGGNFTYTPDGIKDCSQCLFPHNPDSYMEIINKLSQKRK